MTETADRDPADFAGPYGPNPLGECARCHGGLNVRGDSRGAEVFCPSCGLDVPDHPVAAADRAARARATPPAAFRATPMEYAHDFPARVLALEKQVADLRTAVAMLQQARKR